MTKAISRNLTSDGVLNNYNLLPEQYKTDVGLMSTKYINFAGGGESYGGELKANDTVRFSYPNDGDPVTVKFSISMWVNPLELGTNVYFFRKGDYRNDLKREYYCGLRNDKLTIEIYDESVDVYKSVSAAVAWDSTNNLNKWHHIIFIYQGSIASVAPISTVNNLYIYANGSLLTTDATSPNAAFVSMEDQSGRLYMGDYNFKGYINEVSLWSSNISAYAEQFYNSGCPTNLNAHNTAASDLVSWWRMGDNSLDAIDGTGNDSSNNRIKDVVSGFDLLPSSGFRSTDIISIPYSKVSDQCTTAGIPFSLGAKGVPFLRQRPESAPYKANLD